jgi:hypothetical protein
MATKNFRIRNGIDVGPETGGNNTVLIDVTTGNIIINGNLTLNADQGPSNSVITANYNTDQSTLFWDGTLWNFADQVTIEDNLTQIPKGVQGRIAGNDYWFVGGYSISGSSSNDGAMVIASGNNGDEPIYVRQYTGSGTPFPAGNTITRELTLLDASGNTVLPVSLQLNGSTSGSSKFSAPATGSTLTYILPGTAGAANTVLTNDGSGNLSWALPGGGGSTFGNITVGVVTDNTISTTTGDLVLASATNLIDATSATINAQNLTVNSNSSIGTFTLTTTSTSTVSFATTTRNAMSVLIYIVQGANVHCVNATVLKIDASTAMLTTYGEMYNTSALATFSADVSGGLLRLLVTPSSATSTAFSAVRTSLT